MQPQSQHRSFPGKFLMKLTRVRCSSRKLSLADELVTRWLSGFSNNSFSTFSLELSKTDIHASFSSSESAWNIGFYGKQMYSATVLVEFTGCKAFKSDFFEKTEAPRNSRIFQAKTKRTVYNGSHMNFLLNLLSKNATSVF